MSVKGQGVPQNVAEGRRLIAKAIESGVTPATTPSAGTAVSHAPKQAAAS
jgi:hypothetical protein